MSVTKDCDAGCERMPECARCHKRKAPVGRSVPLAAAGGYCDNDCPGYREEPTPGHLWPGEVRADRDARKASKTGGTG